MFRYFLQLAYDGTNYHGWQVQRNANSVQQEITKALATLLKTEADVVGCGRTDTGVHANQYFLHFDHHESLKKNEIVKKMNGILPIDIAIYDLLPVHSKAHARFDAVKRTYQYLITTKKNPFMVNRAHLLFSDLDINKMNEAARYLLTQSDFASFCKLGSDIKTSVCKIEEAAWRQQGDLLIFTVSADRFLRNMVRAVVGTLLEVGLCKMSLAEFKNVVSSGQRSNAGASVPACGLYLSSVTYPENIFIK